MFLFGVITAASIFILIFNLLLRVFFRKFSKKEKISANLLGMTVTAIVTAFPFFANTISYLAAAPVDWIISALGDTPAYVKFPIILLFSFTPVFLISLTATLLALWFYKKYAKHY